MTNPPTPKRFRPRFSIRTLAILLTLVCCYAACWGPTKTRGVADVTAYIDDPMSLGWNASANTPFVVGIDVLEMEHTKRRYYFWFFGYVAKLPYEREIEEAARYPEATPVEAVPDGGNRRVLFKDARLRFPSRPGVALFLAD